MKRASFLMLAITLTCIAACQPNENQNKNANANSTGNANRNRNISPPTGPNDKEVQIFIHDVKGKPGYYDIEDPSPVTLHTLLKQQVYWCVKYDGDPSLTPEEVVISGFRTISGPSITNPFGSGSPSDNDFHLPGVEINNCMVTLHSPKTSVVIPTNYKYSITAKVHGEDRGNKDPQVVIDN